MIRRRLRMTGPGFAGLLAAAAGVVLSAQQRPQQPTFRADVNTVPVYVTVTDGAGGFALNLTRDDFEVRDNGKVQTITQFTTTAQPLSVVVLIDGSSSMWPVFRSVLESANNFILRMLPEDRTAIASFSDRFQMRQPFTSNRDELLKHLMDQFNVRLGMETRLWDGLHESILALAQENGRRVVLVLSDGKDWTDGGSGPYSRTTAAGLAIQRDVMIYAISMWTRWEGLTERPSPALARLADETGGGYVELRETDDLNAAFTRVAQDLHQQYVLGFTPQQLDGKVHRLEVRVKTSGMKVRARRSYLAAAEPAR